MRLLYQRKKYVNVLIRKQDTVLGWQPHRRTLRKNWENSCQSIILIVILNSILLNIYNNRNVTTASLHN